MEESAKYHRLAYNVEIREKKAECSKQIKANVKSLDSFFLRERERNKVDN
jgi:hypothetical protein